MTRLLLAAALAIPLWLAPAFATTAANETVHMSQFAFSPATVTVTVGDTVTWTNHDEAPHDAVTTDAPAPFRSPLLQQDQSWSFTFTVAGTYRYYCSIHPSMRATVIVRPKPQSPKPSPSPTVSRAPSPALSPTLSPTLSPAPAPPPSTVDSTPVSRPASPPDSRPLIVTVTVTVLASLLSLLLLASSR